MDTSKATVTLPYDEYQQLINDLKEARKEILIQKRCNDSSRHEILKLKDDIRLYKMAEADLKRSFKYINNKNLPE